MLFACMLALLKSISLYAILFKSIALYAILFKKYSTQNKLVAVEIDIKMF